MIVFFQAEDGIRDLVRSRGLGDVYKRQVDNEFKVAAPDVSAFQNFGRPTRAAELEADHIKPVSYTHLTLPTSDLV